MSYTIRDAIKTYGIEAWGNEFFGVNAAGHLTVHPRHAKVGIDLYDLIARLRRRKLRFPVLLRFPQMLHSRVDEIFDAFDRAIDEFDYPATYRGVYPIKVNQQESVLAELLRAGHPRGMGLEVGSKAELSVALAQDLHPEALIICNGYKDESYVRLALQGRALGRNVVLIAEKQHEIELILQTAERARVDPLLGIRIRLVARGSGKWERSSGPQAKFGLTTQELVDSIDVLKRYDKLDCFRLLHFHVGSQITEIKRIKNAVKEGVRVYSKLHAEGCRLQYLDVGGGLGVDYDGSNTSYEASMNYDVREYANDVVYMVREICEAENVPAPILVSESGRALVAYHSLLLCEVSGQNVADNGDAVIVPEGAHESVQELWEIWRGMNRKNHREYLHDAEERRDELLGHFELGYLSLRDRAMGERLMMRVSRKALAYAKEERYVPDEFEALEKRLVTKYIANFSVFQSIPDSWALDQLFPVVPVHRLTERPSVQATLCDVTCDSEGEIDRFIDLVDVNESLPMHPLRPGEPYYVAILLIGAYQDVLGDYHNLFGRVDEAHVVAAKNGAPRIVRVEAGDEATDVLRLFGHDPDTMREQVQSYVEQAIAHRTITKARGKKILREYDAALNDYTYLDL